MIYRVANIKDIKEIIEMKNEVKQRIINLKLEIWKNNYPLDSMIIEDVENKEGRVVEIEGKIVAYAVFHHASKEYDKKTFKKENVYSFGRLMVSNEFVGKHIGDFLVKSMIEEAKSKKIEGMGILVDSCNHVAINLYKKYGFKKEGENQFIYAYLDIYGLYF